MAGSNYWMLIDDEQPKLASKGIHSSGGGGFVVLRVGRQEVTFSTTDLPALAVVLAEAAKAALDLSRQELNQKVRKAEPANELNLAKLSELAGISD